MPNTRQALSMFLLLFGLMTDAQAQVEESESDSACNRALAFGEYLLQSGQYNIASTEFERLLYYCPAQDTIRYYLLKANRMAGKYNLSYDWYQKWKQEDASLSMSAQKEFVFNQLLNGRFQDADYEQDGETIFSKDTIFRNNLQLGLMILRNEWPQARNTALNCISCSEELLLLSRKTDKLKMKKPLTAASLSVIVPGLGKAYVGNWKDGVFSLLFTASNGYASYRGFRNNGIQSAYGWIFGLIGGGFYIGNIYGSAKAANVHNSAVQTSIHEETLDILVPTI